MEPPAQFRDPVRIWNRVRSHFFIPGDGCFGEGTGTDVLLLRNRWEHGHTGLRLRAGYPDRPGLPTGIAAADCQALFVPDAAGATFDERSGFDCIRPEAEAPDGSSVEPHDRTSVAAGFVAQVSYIGRRGTRLLRAYDLNQINADPILPSFLIMQQNMRNGCRPDGTGCANGVAVPILTSGIVPSAFVNTSLTQSDLTLNAAGNFAGRLEQTALAAKLRPNQQFAKVTYIDSGGDSYYHSAQATLRKRFGDGLLAGLAYTYGKSIDDQSVDPVGATSGGGLSTTNSRTPTDTRDWRQERGRSDFDRRHVLTASSLWEFPVGKQKRFASSIHPALNHMVGGWSVNGIYTFMSGEPFSVRSGVRTSNFSHESRADIVGAKPQVRLQEVPGVIGPVVFKDATGFAIPAPGTNGSGRNIFEAPGYWNLDLGIGKRFELTERFNLQFRAELFNVLNHPNFDNPRDASSGSPSIRSTVFAQTCCQTVAPPTTQTIISTGEAPRVIQFALKMLW